MVVFGTGNAVAVAVGGARRLGGMIFSAGLGVGRQMIAGLAMVLAAFRRRRHFDVGGGNFGGFVVLLVDVLVGFFWRFLLRRGRFDGGNRGRGFRDLRGGLLRRCVFPRNLLAQAVVAVQGFGWRTPGGFAWLFLGGQFVAGQRLGAHRIARAIGAGIAVAVATAAATTPAGAMVGIGVGGARVTLFFGDQRLPVGDRDLVIVGMDFGERQEAVAVAAVIDERRLQRRFNPGDFGEVNVTAKLLAVSGLEVEFFDAVAA